jgi:hypothetical protein
MFKPGDKVKIVNVRVGVSGNTTYKDHEGKIGTVDEIDNPNGVTVFVPGEDESLFYYYDEFEKVDV